MDRKVGTWLGLCVAALPALLPLWFILEFGVDMPHWDQWEPDFAELYIKAADGGLSLWDFTAQHNEHRMFIPKVLAFALGLATGWNTIAEMLLQWVIVLMTSLCLLYLTRQSIGEGAMNGWVILHWFLSNLMLFSLAQHENWLWGIGLMNAMPGLFLVAAMAALYTPVSRPVQVGLSIVLCAAAMFSSGQGTLAFPLVGVLALWSSSWEQLKLKRQVLIAWGGGFLICAVMFVYGYSLLPPFPGEENVTLWDRTLYLVTFMGNQFVHAQAVRWQTLGLVCGTIVIGLFLAALGYFHYIWLRVRDEPLVRRMLPWLLLGLYVLLNACIASFFRNQIGLRSSISSRYTTVTLYMYIALIHLVPIICQDLRTRYAAVRLRGMTWSLEPAWSRLPTLLGTALLVCWLYAIAPSWQGGALTSYSRLQAKAALLLINVLPENPKLARNVFPKVDELKQRANRLAELGYLRPAPLKTADANMIRDPRYVSQDPGKSGAFERMAESGPDTMTASGWASDPDSVKPVDAVVLTVLNERQQEVIFACSDGVNRRLDLVMSSGDERYELTGWQINYPTSVLPRQLNSIVISAWALNANTGKLRPLPGRPVLTRVQQERAAR